MWYGLYALGILVLGVHSVVISQQRIVERAKVVLYFNRDVI